MTDLRAFAATLGDGPLTVAEVRSAWQAWALTYAPHAAPPDPDAFHALVRRRDDAVRAAASARPLSFWRHDGRLRTSQRLVLDTVPDSGPLHVVAPPGAGKTLLGLLLAARHGTRALALAPTTTIARQWVDAARGLAPDAATVSGDPLRLGDCTVLTYQRLSVLDRGDAFAPVARERWATELADAGRTDADTWLSTLATEHPKAYEQGIRRRSRAVRARLSREDPAALAGALHPNARALADAIVAHGVETIVLDECHHLLDHWALVVAYLSARIEAAGRTPLLIGLTATLPSPQDRASYENYTGLLGDVDVEIPTPAVVKEGNLAPYRDLAWFTDPTPDERAFLRTQDERLADLVADTLGSGDGVDFLHALLGADATADAEVAAAPIAAGIAAAFAADFAVAEAAGRMLARVAPSDPLLALLPDTGGAIGDEEIRILGRYLLERVLPVPERARAWEHARRLLADFGWTLTDRGVRRGRDPIDTILATSLAKDLAVVDILRTELAGADGERVRAVVVCDFATHGNRAGRDGAAGALRTFEVLVADPVSVPLAPVLVTAKHLRVASRDLTTLLPRLTTLLGVTPEIDESTDRTSELRVPGASAARIVSAVSQLVTDGFVRVLVGTRGLLGEGWDCPAVNTLIDLTSVTTASATQQLRGRTFRVDPRWPQKVAHNWAVCTVIDGAVSGDRQTDVGRLRRKLGRLWGVDADGVVVRGVAHTLTADQLALLAAAEHTPVVDLAARLNALGDAALVPRARTRALWRVGSAFTGEERHLTIVRSPRSPVAVFTPPRQDAALGGVIGGAVAVFGTAVGLAVPSFVAGDMAAATLLAAAATGTALATVSPVRRLLHALRLRFDPVRGHRAVVLALVDALVAGGTIRAVDESAVTVHPAGDDVAVTVAGASRAEQDALRDALRELYGSVRTPRFLLSVDRGEASGGRLVRLAARLADRGGQTGAVLAVPTVIGRRRALAEAFADAWRRRVGGATLHEAAADPELVVSARRSSADRRLPTSARDVWA